MLFKTLLTVVATSLLLAGCGPIYDTTYTWKPPTNSAGVHCVQTCQMIKHSCQNQCTISKQRCQTENAVLSSLAANISHREHSSEKSQTHSETKQIGPHATEITTTSKSQRTSSGFNPGAISLNCNQTCSCDDDYRICFTSCGGRVIEHQECVFNCPSAK